MKERDIELHRQAGWSDSKLIELVRADAMETATRAANMSWSLVCKKMVELEREACAKVCEKQIEKENLLKTGDNQTLSNLLIGHRVTAHMTDARLIRARGNT